MSEEEKKPTDNTADTGDQEKTGNKRRLEEVPSVSIPTATSAVGIELPPWVAGGSPIKFISPEELLNTSIAMDNLALVHEIAVDPHFRIENAALAPLEQAVRDNMYRAYWDLLREDLAKDPPSYEQAFKLLLEIKQEILDSLLSVRHVRLRAEVEMILNENTLRAQLDENNLDVKAVSLFILELLGRLCCPERDETIEKLRQEDGIVELISGIFHLIDTMKNDLTNYAISQNRKVVEDHSAKIEYDAFLKYCEHFPDGSKMTRAWLKKAYLELFPRSETEPAAKRERETSDEDLYMTISARGYLNLVRHVDASPFPETLRIDQPRYRAHAYQFLQNTVVASTVLVTCNVAGKEIAEAQGFKMMLKDHLLALAHDLNLRGVPAVLDDFAVQAVKDAQEEAGRSNVTITKEQEESIKRQIAALDSENHPVRSLVYNRMGHFVEQILRNPSGPSHPLGAGISVIEKDLCQLLSRVLRLASHNRKTFERLYKQIISEIVAELEGREPVPQPSTSAGSSNNS